MIVYESSFPAAEKAAGRPLTRPRILYSSYTRNAGIDAADVTVSTETTDGPRDGPLRPETYDYWQGTAVPATWTLDLGSDFSTNAVGLVHNCGTSGNTILAETAANAAPSTFAEFADPTTPTDDSATLFLDVARNVRKLKLTFSNGSAPRIAVVYLGLVLPMEKGVQPGHQPLNLSRMTDLSNNMSEDGHFLGQTFRAKGFEAPMSLRNLTPSWYRTNFDPFVRSGRIYPYFIGWNPEEWPADIAYAWHTRDIAPRYMDVPLFEVNWTLVGFDV